MGLDLRKCVFGVSDKARLKPVSSSTETSYNSEILLVASLHVDMILYNKRITKAFSSDVQADLRLCCSQTPKTGFLALRSNMVNIGLFKYGICL